MTSSYAYHPLNVLKPVTDDIWVVDARLPSRHFEMPIRMTVLRLADGGLVLHSPTPYNRALHDQLTELGTIRHLVVPNTAHWMYAKGWQDAVPPALTFAVEGLRSRAQDTALRIDKELREGAQQFGQEIETVLFSAPNFQEAVLFHRPTRTLILTDMVQNFEPERLPRILRPLGAMLGVTAPNGRAPVYLRLLVRLNKSGAAQAAQRLVDFDPERVIFAHGKYFESDAGSQLRRSFHWLLATEQDEQSRRPISPWLPAGVALGGLLLGIFVWRKSRRRSRINRVAEDLLDLVRSKRWGR